MCIAALCAVSTTRGSGTGFSFLAPGWVVTARHVVAGVDSEPIRLTFGPDAVVPARILFAHARVDVAVLQADGPLPHAVPLRPHDGPLPERLAYAGAQPLRSDPRSSRFATCLTQAAWYERSRRHRDGDEEDMFIVPAPDGEPGHSGGPLLTPDGAVVGVITDGITLGGARLLRATSIAPVRARLLGASPAQSSDNTSSASPNS
jgi:S1-C subfamily serine protease